MNPRMTLSDKGASFIKNFEELRLHAYPDERGVWTIGWGHTGDEVVEGLDWSPAQAETAFWHDVAWAQDAVNDLVVPSLAQSMFDALVSFTFNEGRANLAKSTLLKLVNACDFAGAQDQFRLWNKVRKGKVLVTSGGLIKRRAAEAVLFGKSL